LKDISTQLFVRYHKHNGWQHRYFLKGYVTADVLSWPR